MPTPIYHDAVDDIIATVVKDYHTHKGTWQDISMNFPEYMFAEKFLSGKKKTVSDSSHTLVFDIQFGNSGEVREVGLFDTDQEDRQQIMAQGEVKWAWQNVGIYFDVNEVTISSGKHRIIDHITAQVHSMYNRWFESMSHKMWTSPSDSTDANRKILGIAHWIVKNASEGFNGGNHGGSWAQAGLNRSTYTGLKNYTGTFSAVSQEDFVTKVVRAMRRCHFKSPHNYAEAVKQTSDWELVTTEANYEECDLLLRAQNDNLGSDLAAFRGQAMLKSMPLRISWELTKSTLSRGEANPAYDSANPIYGLYWPSFRLNFLKGMERKLTGPTHSATQRFVRKLNLDSQNQMYNINPRNNFVLYQA
jgi:hypothetical protein